MARFLSKGSNCVCAFLTNVNMDQKTVSEQFPIKVELHVHMDGAARYQTILDVAKQRGINLHCDTIPKLRDEIVLFEPSSLDRLLHSFATFTPVFSGSQEAVYRLAYEFCEDTAKQGTTYIEARYSPHLLANTFEKPVYALESGNYSPRDVVTTVTDALAKGSQDFNITVKKWSLEVAELCRDFQSNGVVGIDIAGPEYLSGKDPTQCPHKLAFRDVENAGMHRTAHASEVKPPEMVYEALDEYHAERIGHGYRSLECKDMYARLLRERIHMETCPISSILTGGAPNGKDNHPILKFADDKANFSLSTDDPTVLDNNLSDDFAMACDLGLTDEQITQSIFNAAQSAFASEREKKQLLMDLVKVYGDQWINNTC